MRFSPTRSIQAFSFAAAVILLLAAPSISAQDSAPKSPRITGISHVAYFVSDLPKTISFWHDFLGFDESYSLTKKDSKDIRIAFIKIMAPYYETSGWAFDVGMPKRLVITRC